MVQMGPFSVEIGPKSMILRTSGYMVWTILSSSPENSENVKCKTCQKCAIPVYCFCTFSHVATLFTFPNRSKIGSKIDDFQGSKMTHFGVPLFDPFSDPWNGSPQGMVGIGLTRNTPSWQSGISPCDITMTPWVGLVGPPNLMKSDSDFITF